MKAIFDFIPKFCPNCGQRLFYPSGAEYLDSLRTQLDNYHAGSTFTCDKCELEFEKAQSTPQPKTIHFWPGPDSRVTACRLELFGMGNRTAPLMTSDRKRVTCRNCRRALGVTGTE